MTPDSAPYARRYHKLSAERDRLIASIDVKVRRIDALMDIERNAYAESEGLDTEASDFEVEVPAPARSGRPKVTDEPV